MKILMFLDEVLEHILSSSPSSGFFSNLRYHFYRSRMVKGSGPFGCLTGFSISCPEKVFIGRNVNFNRYVTISACHGAEISIGDDCLIGPFVLIRSADHAFSDVTRPIIGQGHTPGRIVIGENCWIGGHVTITKGVTIGSGSIIGANSVVTRDIPPNAIAAGNPARVIRQRE